MIDIIRTSVHWNAIILLIPRFPGTQEDGGGGRRYWLMVQKEFMLYFPCLFLSSQFMNPFILAPSRTHVLPSTVTQAELTVHS